ncbi:MAG: hypothetical protein ACXWBS_02540 [Chthoniobacterales bacterium]
MNDFSELESELKQLRPVAPSADLVTRVERALQDVSGVSTAGVLPRRSRVRVNWFVIGFGLAAATAFFILMRVNVDHPSQSKAQRVASTQTAPAPAFVSDGMTRVVYHTADDGLVYPANFSEPARRIRSRSRETLAFKDPSSGASLRVSYPTEEVELVPVSLSVH